MSERPCSESSMWSRILRSLSPARWTGGGLFVILVWILLYLPRIFVLGFYGDDWFCFVDASQGTMPFSPARFLNFVGFFTSYAPRPVLGLIAFLFSSIFGTSAWGFQLGAAVLVLAAALSLRRWLSLLLADVQESRSFCADGATIFWLAMPWMLGVTAWPVLSQTLVAQIFFTEACRILLTRKVATISSRVLFAVLLVASGLTYEAFYFQIFIILGFYAISFKSRFRWRYQLLPAFGLACSAQLIVILVNRYSARVNPAFSKHWNAEWFRTAESSLLGLPRILKPTIAESFPFVCAACVVLTAACTALLAVGMRRESSRPLALRIVGIFLLGVGATCVSAVTFALAGYSFQSDGVSSRTLFSASWGFTIVYFGLISCFAIKATMVSKMMVSKWCLALSGAAVVVGMGYAQRYRVDEWAHAWHEQQKILAHVPASQIKELPRNSAVFFVGPGYYRGVPIFGAVHDITSAVFSLPPLAGARRPHNWRTPIYPATELYAWKWNGENITISQPGSWSFTYATPTKHLYVWKYPEERLEEVSAGFVWPPPDRTSTP